MIQEMPEEFNKVLEVWKSCREEVMNGIIIREVETKNIMTKSSLPVGGYSVNPSVGCTHACKYCYASMKRFTAQGGMGHFP